MNLCVNKVPSASFQACLFCYSNKSRREKMATMDLGDLAACVQLMTSTDGSCTVTRPTEPDASVFSPPTSPKAVLATASGGPKHKLIGEADIQVCRLNHTSTIVSKIMNSKYLRRWETHKVVLDHSEIRSTTVWI